MHSSLAITTAGKPKGRMLICWKLLSDLPVEDLESAVEKVDW